MGEMGGCFARTGTSREKQCVGEIYPDTEKGNMVGITVVPTRQSNTDRVE